MSSDENMQTQPTPMAILERINAVGEQLDARIDTLQQSMAAEFAKVNTRIGEIEQDLHLLNRSFEKVAGYFVKKDARQDLLEDRIAGLEKRFS